MFVMKKSCDFQICIKIVIDMYRHSAAALYVVFYLSEIRLLDVSKRYIC